jgi:hypothetical protein
MTNNARYLFKPVAPPKGDAAKKAAMTRIADGDGLKKVSTPKARVRLK